MPLRTEQYLPNRQANVSYERPLIIGLDPGKTTGAAILYPTGWWTIAEVDNLPGLWDLLRQLMPKVVVCEKFVPQPRAHDVTALEVIGVIKLYVQQLYDVNMIFQMPAAAKNFVSDVMLRRNDLFNVSKGMRHARDAIRHVVYYLVHVLGDKTWIEVMRG